MNRYRTKHCEIEAIQWNGINLEEIKAFVGESLIYSIVDAAWKVGKGRPRVIMKIKTLEGDMNVSVGDYIIKGLRGEYYPCKPDVFDKKYILSETRTNADRIREMNIDELARIIRCPHHVDKCFCDRPEEHCEDCCKEWLESEAEE